MDVFKRFDIPLSELDSMVTSYERFEGSLVQVFLSEVTFKKKSIIHTVRH